MVKTIHSEKQVIDLKKKKKKRDSTPDGKSLNINNDKIIKLSL